MKIILLPLILILLILGVSVTCALGEDIDMAKIAMIESSNNPLKYNSKSGAVGLYQITLPALKDYNTAHIRNGYTLEDMYNPDKAYIVANWYINTKIPRYLYNLGIEDTIENRLISYNWGIGNLNRYKKGLSTLPKETSDYIIKYNK